MYQAKVIQLLKTLSSWELKSFQHYVASPFFNVNETVINLLELLVIEYPEFEESAITYESIYKKLFQNQKFNTQKLRYVMTDLTLLLEGFLAYFVYEENFFYQKKFLLQKLNEKNLDKYFQQHLALSYKSQNENDVHDMEFYKRQFGYDEIAYGFTAVKTNRSIDTQLQSLSDNLDIYYLINKLKYCCEILNRQNILQVNYKVPFLDFIINYLETGSLKQVPLITIYFQILNMLRKSENEKHYVKFKATLKQFVGQLSNNELRDIYSFAQNYCIRKINIGNTKYLAELFEIYKQMLEAKIIFENNELSHAHFKNITAIAFRLHEFKWAEKFIHKYSTFLNKELRKNSVHYNLARCHFARNEHRQALKVLTSVEFTDVYYHLDSKSLLLKIYYETEEFEPLFSLVNTLRVYLRRSKVISNYQRDIYANLVTQTRRLAKIKSGSNYSLLKVKTSIANNQNIADISWLNEKIKELEK